MGLDMYLSKKTYVKNWAHTKPEGRHQVIVKKNGKEVDTIDFSKVSYIEEEIAYWRKANQIHNWFVENVQDGVDNCQDHWVNPEKLEELINACKEDIEYLNSLEKELSPEQEDFLTKEKFRYTIFKDVDENKLNLPTQSGFFFGSTEYDSYYLTDLENTIEMLEPYLDEKYAMDEFYYRSSW